MKPKLLMYHEMSLLITDPTSHVPVNEWIFTILAK